MYFVPVLSYLLKQNVAISQASHINGLPFFIHTIVEPRIITKNIEW